MGKSIIGFHYAMGGNKQGIGDFMRKLNEAGIPFLVKGADDAGICFEAQQTGKAHGVDNWIIYRQSRIGPPENLQDDVPDYLKSPAAAAEEHWQKVVGHWPQELDKSIVWMEPINEPRAKASPDDRQWQDMHPTDWLGWFMLEYARIANANGFKVCGPSFNSGEPEVFSTNEYGLPGMVAYLKHCAENPQKAALSVHEYVWRRWKDAEDWDDWYPNLWGRVEAAMAAADANNIPRDFSIFVTEWGFAHEEAPRWPECEPHLTAYNAWAARWPQVKGVAAWTLQGGWGDVDDHVQSWIAPLTDYARSREFDVGAQPAQPHSAIGTVPGHVEPSEPQPGPTVVSGDWQAPSEPLVKGWIWVERVERKGELGRVHKDRLWLREEPNDVTARKLGLVPIGAIVRITGVPQGDDPVYYPVEVSKAALESVDTPAPVSPQPDAAPEPPGAAGIAEPSDTGEGFDSPVGTPDQRRGARVWPEHWEDATPYLKRYTFGQPERTAFHTGADLNLNFPHHDADKDKPVYACASGVVIFARLVPDSSWGNLVVIRHTMPDGRAVHSRYGHLKQIDVAKGEQVHRGRQIGTIGGAVFGLANHLHFDISPSGILQGNPTHWPGSNQQAVRDHYVDPCQFIRKHRPSAAPARPVASPEQPAPAETAPLQPIGTKQVIADEGLFLREGPDKTFDSKLLMDKGTLVEILEEGTWDHVRLGDVVGYASSKWLSPLTPAGEGHQKVPIQPAEGAESTLGAPEVITLKHVIAPAGLKLREGRSTAFRELLTMPEGTAVEVLEEGEWDHVRVGGVTGYAFSQYLSAGQQVAAQPGPAPAGPAAFTPDEWQRAIWAITGVFESGTPEGRPDAFQNQDAGIISYGKHQATLQSGNLARVLAAYFRRSNSPASQALQQEYGQRIQQRDEALRNDARLKELLLQAAGEEAMSQAQDEVFEQNFYRPVIDRARQLGVRTPLGLACLYDTRIQGGLDIVASAVAHKLGVSGVGQTGPAGVVDEPTWLRTFLDEREARLNRLADKRETENRTIEAQWLRNSTFRVVELRRLLDAGNLELAGEFVVRGQRIQGLRRERTTVETPAAPVMTPGSYSGPKVDFVAGIHGPGDAFTWHDPGFRAMIEKLGIPVKFMSDGDRSNWYEQFRKPSLELVRVFWHPDPNRRKTAREAWEEDMRDGVMNFYKRGARHFEVHNEPRLPKEGMGSQWSNGAEFGNFLRQLMQIIKQNCPDARLWYPGESPGVPWTDQFAFSRPAYERVADLCYGLCQHAYSGNTADVNTAVNEIVGQVRKFHEGMEVWDKPIIVSECSVNRAASTEFRAKVYTQVSQQLRQIPGVKGVFWYTSHWNAPENERANAESWYGTDLAELYKQLNP